MSELFKDKHRELLSEAVDTWGIEAQAHMAEEEAAEFIVASKHFARGKATEDELIDELADIRIMYEQLSMWIGQEQVEHRVHDKMNRLRERVNKESDQ